MQREIKFRAWDKNTDSWHYFKAGEQWADNGSPIYQYTGLKDKNGREIYEGDILRYSFGEGAGYVQHVGEVLWDIDFFTVDKLAGWWTKTFDTRSRESLAASTNKPVCEVIGNLWENPERLK